MLAVANVIIVPALGVGLLTLFAIRDSYWILTASLPVAISAILTPAAFKYWVKCNKEGSDYTWQKSILLALGLTWAGCIAGYCVFIFIILPIIWPN